LPNQSATAEQLALPKSAMPKAKQQTKQQEEQAVADRRKRILAHYAWLQSEQEKEERKRKKDSEPEGSDESDLRSAYNPGLPL